MSSEGLGGLKGAGLEHGLEDLKVQELGQHDLEVSSPFPGLRLGQAAQGIKIESDHWFASGISTRPRLRPTLHRSE